MAMPKGMQKVLSSLKFKRKREAKRFLHYGFSSLLCLRELTEIG